MITYIIVGTVVGLILIALAIAFYLWNLRNKNKNPNNKHKDKIKTDKIFYKNNHIISYSEFANNNSGVVVSSGKKKFTNNINNKFVIDNLNKRKNKKIDKKDFCVSVSRLNSSIVIAPPGSGKTQALLLPTIYYNIRCKDKPLMIISDPKGEILENLNNELITNDYKVITLSIIENKKNNEYITEFWNPLDNLIKIHKTLVKATSLMEKQQIASEISNEINFVTEIFSKISDDNKKEYSFWKDNATNLIRFVLTYMLIEVEKGNFNYDHINFKNLYNNVNNTKLETLKKLAKAVRNNDDNSGLNGIIKNYLNWSNENENNIKSFITTASTAMGLFDKIYFSLLTSKSTFDIDELLLGDKPLAIFLTMNISSTSTKSDSLLLSLYLSILNKKIDTYKRQNQKFKEKKVWWFLDEIGNITKLDFLESIVAYGRGNNIFALSIFQSYEQIKEIYSPALLDSCEYRILFNNDNIEIAKKISDLTGKYLDDRNQYINKLGVDKIANIPNGYIGLWTFKKKNKDQNFYYLPVTYFYMIRSIHKNSNFKTNAPYLLADYERFINCKINETKLIDNSSDQYINKIKKEIDNKNNNDHQNVKKWEIFKSNLLENASLFSNDDFKKIKQALSMNYLYLSNIAKNTKVDHYLLNRIIDNEVMISNMFNEKNIKYINPLLDEILSFLLEGKNIIFNDERFKDE